MFGPFLGQCSDLRRRRVALDLLLASHSTLTELEQREVELLLQSQAWDEPPLGAELLGAELLGRPTTRLDSAAQAARAAAQQATAHGPHHHLAWDGVPPGHGHGRGRGRGRGLGRGRGHVAGEGDGQLAGA